MTLLNHIGVFLLLIVIWSITGLLATMQNSKNFNFRIELIVVLIASTITFTIFESFYWIIQIFFK